MPARGRPGGTPRRPMPAPRVGGAVNHCFSLPSLFLVSPKQHFPVFKTDHFIMFFNQVNFKFLLIPFLSFIPCSERGQHPSHHPKRKPRETPLYPIYKPPAAKSLRLGSARWPGARRASRTRTWSPPRARSAAASPDPDHASCRRIHPPKKPVQSQEPARQIFRHRPLSTDRRRGPRHRSRDAPALFPIGLHDPHAPDGSFQTLYRSSGVARTSPSACFCDAAEPGPASSR